MELKPGYKQTEVGVIPEEWESRTFGQICRVNQGLQVAIEDRLKYPTTTSKTYITIQFLNDRKTIEYINDYPPSACCSNDDVLMTRTGNTGIVVSGVEGVFHNNFFKINFDRRKLDRDFLVGFLSLSSTRKIILEKAGTSTIPDLNHGDFYSIHLPLPPLPEQRAIAAALSDVDGLLCGLDRLIAKKRDLKQAAMQQLLTGQTRLPGFEGEWEVKRLGDVAPLQRGFDLPNPQLKSGPYPVVYSNGIMNHHATFQVKGPGVITGRSGTLGKVTFVEDDYWPHNTSLWVTNFKGHDPKFIFYLYTKLGFERFASGSGVPTLNRNDAHAYQVLIPPSLSEQTAIAEVLTEMDAELAALAQRREKTRALKQAMMQELLTGRTRLQGFLADVGNGQATAQEAHA